MTIKLFVFWLTLTFFKPKHFARERTISQRNAKYLARECKISQGNEKHFERERKVSQRDEKHLASERKTFARELKSTDFLYYLPSHFFPCPFRGCITYQINIQKQNFRRIHNDLYASKVVHKHI